MNVFLGIFNLLSIIDWLALVWFALAWAVYAWYAKAASRSHSSLLQVTNRYRHEWLVQTTSRDPRMMDSVITQSLSQTPSFFCSTTILVIGGLLAMLSSSEKTVDLVSDIPFLARTSSVVLGAKLITLLIIFVYAFFRFSWSMRQYTFVALTIGGMPPPSSFASGEHNRDVFATRAARLVALAAESFNDGLRAYYFAFAVIAWFVSSFVFFLTTVLVVFVLYRREFKSEVLEVLGSQVD